jgi:type II secretory ATPase GspE/PulE/Tfp pilus assembly ATPase PilB-like protein
MAFNIEKKVTLLHSQEQETRAREAAHKQGLYYVDLKKVLIELDDLKMLPVRKAKKNQVGVVARVGKHLKLATTDPALAKGVIEEFQTKGYKTSLFLVSNQSFLKLLNAYKDIPKDDDGDDVVIKEEDIAKFEKFHSLGELEEEIKKASTTELLNLLLGGGLGTRSSDIHLEPSGNDKTRIRFRIDGILEDITFIDKTSYQEALSRVKLLSKLKLNKKNVPQNGRFSISTKDDPIDIRVSILPGPYGETVVMRLLNPKVVSLDLEELGLNESNLKTLRTELKKPNGMILVTGPTGSGKTTTLYACLTEIHKPGIKIITLEDPIEYKLGGIVQTQIDEAGGYTFAVGLKNSLRQDPDVILVGEIRDREGGSTAMNASLTGHLVFSTLHANDSFGAIPRLVEMGVNPASLAPAINLVIAQRLVRRICPDCEQKGCKKCNKTGFKGRIGIFELLPIDDDMEEMILSKMGPTMNQIKKHALGKGLKTMYQDGMEKVKKGLTTKGEIERVSSE